MNAFSVLETFSIFEKLQVKLIFNVFANFKSGFENEPNDDTTNFSR